ncbi:MAG: phage baseplate protein [Pseudomonadota bacterium]
MPSTLIRSVQTSRNSPNFYRTGPDGQRTEGNQAFAPLLFEATVSESHSQTAMVATHPVEDGIDVTDFVRPGHATLNIEAAFSNNPTEAENRDGVFSGSDNTRIQAAWQTLKEIANGKPVRHLLRVQTGLELYDNMIIENLSTRQDAGNPDYIVVRISMVQVRIVNTGNATVSRVATNIRQGADNSRGQLRAEFGEQTAATILNCEQCAAICGACLERDREQETSENVRFYVVNDECSANGQATLETNLNIFQGETYGDAEIGDACEEISQAIIARNGGLTFDKPGSYALAANVGNAVAGLERLEQAGGAIGKWRDQYLPGLGG